jgi:DNA-binding IclR family transcriptional regulator
VQSDTHLKTVDRALQVLLQFSKEHPEWSSSELAQALGLHRSIVYRILKTLERRGFVTQTDRRGRFSLGLKLIELGNVVLSTTNLLQIADPIMARLVKETDESVMLSVVSGNESVCIGKKDSPKPVRATMSIGDRSPLYAGATAKALLAHLGADRIDELVAAGLKRITRHTITDAAKLEEDLAEIRRQGWAFSVGEFTPDVAAIAVPLRDSNGTVVASLTTTGLASRFTRGRLPILIDATCRAGEDISAQLVVWHKPQVNAEKISHPKR